MTKVFGGRLTMAKMGVNFGESAENAGDLISVNRRLNQDSRRQFLRRDDDSVIADDLREGVGEGEPRRFAQSCLESGLLLEDEPRAMETAGRRTHGSGSSDGGFSRLIVAAIVLVLAAATFAQARPYTLQWDANSDGVTAGYLVSYGTASGSYGSTSDIDAGSATSFQVDLLPGSTYYFIVKAYTAARVHGPASAEFSFSVPLSATLNVSSTSVSGGATVSAIAASGSGNRLDRIGLYAVGSSTQLDWKYLNGTQSAPATGVTGATVPFTMPTTAGQYQFRFLDSGGAILATSATVTVTVAGGGGGGAGGGTPAITPSSTTVAGGGYLTATVVNGPGNRLDRVALNAVGSSTQLDWKYLNGSQSAPATGVTTATVPFTMPATAGQYQFRFLNSSGSVLATSATVTVTVAGGGGGGTGGGTPAITLSSTTLAPGANFTGTITNGPRNRLDWVALYAVGANTFLDWKYLNGTQVAPGSGVAGATLTFRAPTTPGTYHLRFFSNNSYTLIATSATLTVSSGGGGGAGGAPAITLSSTTLAPGANFTGTIANGPGSRLDWVALYAVGANTFLDWKYLNGAQVAPASGVMGAALTFRAPTTPGTYHLRFFSNNSYTLIATSATLTVSSSGGGGAGGGAPAVTLSSTTPAPGANFTATVANGPGNALDWIGLYAVGSNTLIDWKYRNGTTVRPTSGQTGWTVNFTAPASAGLYHLMFYSNNTYTLLAASATVTVTSGGFLNPSVTPSATTVANGANLGVTVANSPGNALDWVGLYAVGSNTLIDWKYRNGTTVRPTSGQTGWAVNFTAPTADGLYHLRFFSNNTYTLLATSATVTVQ